MSHTADDICKAVADLADDWRAQRTDRQLRRHLDPADFAELRARGLPLMAVPVDQGGTWVDVGTSVRPTAHALRQLAGGDASVALVSAMHPAVLAYWLGDSGPVRAGLGGAAPCRLRLGRRRPPVGDRHFRARQRR